MEWSVGVLIAPPMQSRLQGQTAARSHDLSLVHSSHTLPLLSASLILIGRSYAILERRGQRNHQRRPPSQSARLVDAAPQPMECRSRVHLQLFVWIRLRQRVSWSPLSYQVLALLCGGNCTDKWTCGIWWGWLTVCMSLFTCHSVCFSLPLSPLLAITAHHWLLTARRWFLTAHHWLLPIADCSHHTLMARTPVTDCLQPIIDCLQPIRRSSDSDSDFKLGRLQNQKVKYASTIQGDDIFECAFSCPNFWAKNQNFRSCQ